MLSRFMDWSETYSSGELVSLRHYLEFVVNMVVDAIELFIFARKPDKIYSPSGRE